MVSSLLIALVLLILVVLIVLATKVFGSQSRNSSSVLIVGPCGAGKTVLYYRLTKNEIVDTVSSMQANEKAGSAESPLRLVDLPGHYRLRGLLPQELESAVAIIFVYDASDAVNQAKPAAELLYTILTTFAASGTGPDLLFVCNKSDNKVVKTTQRVKLMMMNEIETLRKTHNTIQGTSGQDQAKATLGVPGQFFNFDQHSPCKIDFISFSARKDQEVSPILEFIQAHS